MQTLVIGLGNPILGDDGVGWKVIEQIQAHASQFTLHVVETDCLSVGGLSLMERMLGYERVILVDAVQTGAAPGTVHVWQLENLPRRAGGHTASAHDADLPGALEVAKSLGSKTPREVVIIGIEAQKVYDFSETLSPPVAAAIPQSAALVLSQIGKPTILPEAL